MYETQTYYYCTVHKKFTYIYFQYVHKIKVLGLMCVHIVDLLTDAKRNCER
jgi:hypothetical protein